MVGSKFEVDIVVIEFVDEDTSESFGHLIVSSDSPVVAEDSSSRTVKTELEVHLCGSSTIVSYHEVKFLVSLLDLVEVEAVPCLARFYGFACPVEVLGRSTSVVHDVISLKHLS